MKVCEPVQANTLQIEEPSEFVLRIYLKACSLPNTPKSDYFCGKSDSVLGTEPRP